MVEKIWAQVASALGSPVSKASPVSGGDINDAYRVKLADGREVFVKTHDAAPQGLFQAEARGLQWLADARAIALPKVLAVSNDDAVPFLVLELLEPGPRPRDFDERLGRELATLHRVGAADFGLDHDNFIGSLPQPNTVEHDWPSFYRQQRLVPQVRRAARHLGNALQQKFEQLYARLPDFVGAAEPPARLHGDLWGGNLHATASGAPCLIDPAVYGGHREIDLAMMQLFGGFAERVFDAYDEAFPLQPDWRERVPLYQLYPLLVHVNLFGGGYVGSVQRALSRYV
ncbi:MAG TPA: fructosamine kinase family protein [Polyangiaceae bacterium]|nr:fructosamine kinase family protein [Polyangiaceae bacterium]